MTVQALSPNLTDDEIPLFEHLYEMDQYKYSTHTIYQGDSLTLATHYHSIIAQYKDSIKVNNDNFYPN